MYSECSNCQSRVVSAVDQTCSDVQCYKCSTKTEKRIKETHGTEINVKITAREKVDCTHQEMVSTLNSQLPEYKQHAYRVYHQQARLNEMKSQLSQNECILVIDFSENYVCRYASETKPL